ncbi:ATP-binding protein [candidate division GN15 bacterium]|nr:ATP-binding protein [candidate division GN15 bacterium]
MVMSASFFGARQHMEKPIIQGNTIKTPSNQEYLADVDAFLEGTLRGWGVDESVIADIAISVSELVNNAIVHGNKSSPDKVVTVTIAQKNSTVNISVADQGGGFNPESIDDPLAEENLLREVGRGIFIVRSLMDKVDIKPTKEGTEITITKNV